MPLDISCAFFTEALEIGAVCHFDQDELPAAPQDAWVKPMSIMPAAAKEHLRLPGNHNVQPRTDHRQKTQLVWDLPLPRIIDSRPWVCTTCRRSSEQPECLMWHVQPSELDVLVHKRPKKGNIWFTRTFLLFAVQDFYEHWNAKSLRRMLATHYAWNSITLLQRARPKWRICRLPFANTLRSMLFDALEHWLPTICGPLQQAVLQYSGQIVRGDGNYKIGKKLLSHADGKPCRVILAWTGLDGCLLQPPTASPTEDIADIEPDLRSLLQQIRTARLAAGCSLLESQPVAHCTDRYGQHRLQLQRIYQHVWGENALVVEASTAKGDAVSVSARDKNECLTQITGDPFHDVLALRRVAACRLPDAATMVRDHIDCLGRLSAPVEPATAKRNAAELIELDSGLHFLLRATVTESASVWACLG